METTKATAPAEKMTVLVSSCDKFSDLWDTHFMLYRKNWAENPFSTCLITDKKTDKAPEGVTVLATESEWDFPLRIRRALEQIDTPFVLLTLDDYFLIDTVKTEDMTYLLERMEKEGIDYLSLYNRRKTKKRHCRPLTELFPINLSRKYALTLYPAIWSVEFLKKTINENLSPWLYEVSLTTAAVEEGAVCHASLAQRFRMLDVVRKGKVLHRARRYLDREGIALSGRPTISYFTECKLWLLDRVSWYTPRPLRRLLKRVAKRFGMQFFSDD